MKYIGLTLSAFAVALLAVVFFGVAREMGAPTSARPQPPVSLPALTDQQVRDQAQLKDAVSSWSKAASSRSPAVMQLADSDLGVQKLGVQSDFPNPSKTIFALAPSLPVAATPSASVLAKSVRRSDPANPSFMSTNAIALPNVSVVLQAGEEGKAVVDGRLVRVGDKIADGLVLKSIQMDVVTFSSDKEDLLVRLPLPRLRVLGATAQQTKVPQ